jgi:hypothetical protein
LTGIESRCESENEIWCRSENRNGSVNERSECKMKTVSMSGPMASVKCVQAKRAR